MVYRDLSTEKAQELFSEITNQTLPTSSTEQPTLPVRPDIIKKEKPKTVVKSRRKTIKTTETHPSKE